VKKLLVIASLAAVLPITACSTVPGDTTAPYTTAEVPTETTTDAIEGLQPTQQDDYPTLYYNSPGLRRLNTGN
jgi:hypothetical protein